MHSYVLTVLWCGLLPQLLWLGGGNVDCVKAPQGRVCEGLRCATIRPPAVLDNNIIKAGEENNSVRAGFLRRPHCIATITYKECDVGIRSLLSQSYKTLKTLIGERVQELLKNRKDALSSAHPLRHQRWQITLYRKSGFMGLFYETEVMVIDFMEDGSLKTDKGHKGVWWSEYGDVIWKIYFNPEVDVATYFNAQFCWNYFGESAFMRRGVIFQDRQTDSWLPKYLFRPVLGKFTGHGIPSTKV